MRGLRLAAQVLMLVGGFGIASSPAHEARAGECAQARAGDTTAQGRAFERLKALEGTWSMPGDASPMTVTYRTTAAGNVVVETLFPGTPHEMLTVYHRDGADLVLTHYCAAGNDPHLKMEPGTDPSEVSFRFAGAANLGKPTDGHMHDLVLRFVDADRFQAAWTFFKDGKAAETKRFNWTRVVDKRTSTEPQEPVAN